MADGAEDGGGTAGESRGTARAEPRPGATATCQISSLRPDEDAEAVRRFLDAYLREHLRWWSAAMGTAWDDVQIAEHLVWHDLVETDWRELKRQAGQERAFVRVARDASGAPLGVVWAEEGRDRFLRVRTGVLSWVYVAPEARGQGVGGLLMEAADAWMAQRRVAMREVFVTGANAAAVALYASRGYRVVDQRMLGAAPMGALPPHDGMVQPAEPPRGADGPAKPGTAGG